MAGSSRTCYFVNGEIAKQPEPCFPHLEHSTCCGINQCLANGLCHDSKANTTFRGTCTDKSWKSRYCPQYCRINEHQGPRAKNFTAARTPRVWQCSNNSPQAGGSMCCDKADLDTDYREKSCCEPSPINLFSIAPDLSFASSISTLSSASSTPTSDVTTSTPSPRNPSGSKGATIGIAVGVSVAVISLIIGAFYLCQRRRKSKRKELKSSQSEEVVDDKVPSQEISGFQAFEMMTIPAELSTGLRTELPSKTKPRTELPD